MSRLVVKVPWTSRKRPSRRLLRACGVFGLVLDRRAIESRRPLHATCEALERAIRERRAQGVSLLLVGPSGCGKSTILRELASRARRRGSRVVVARALARSRRPIIDLFPGSPERAIGLLARAGLGEAKLLARHANELSDGERARLWLALAMSRIEARPNSTARPALLVIDELTSILDRVTARGVVRVLARFIERNPHVVLVAATPHDDVEEWLTPAITARGELGVSEGGGRWTITPQSRKEPGRTTSRSNVSTIEPRPPRPRSASSRPARARTSRACSSSPCPR